MTIALIVLLILLIGLVVYSYKLNKTLKQEKETNKKLASTCQNQIASLKPVELDTYLESIMTMLLQIDISLHGTTNDPNIKQIIYSRTLVSFTKYLGETWKAIEDRYGENYPFRWYDSRYKVLELNGVIDEMLINPPYSREARSKFETMSNLEAMARLGALGMQIGNKQKKDEAK